MNRKNTFWGLIFIFVALTMIADMTGILETYDLVRVTWTIVLGAYALSRIVKFSFVPASIAIAIGIRINAEYLNIHGNYGLIFLASILFGVGLSMLIKPKRKRKTYTVNINGETIDIDDIKNKKFNTTEESLSGEHVYFENNLGENSQYVQSDNLKTARIENNLGHSRIYFDNVTFNQENCVINVECNLGKVTLYFPNNINLQNTITTSLGSLKGARSFHENDAYPTVFLTGESNLGEIEVIVSSV